MRAPERFVITITGSIDEVRSRHVVQLDRYVLGRYIELLMLGDPLPEDIGRPWGVMIEVRENAA